jgi:alkyl hydroperoxide reductase subunit AhpC
MAPPALRRPAAARRTQQPPAVRRSDRPPGRRPRAQVVGCSVDSQFTHLAWVNTPRNKGGLGAMSYPLLADLTKSIAKDYGVLIEDGPDAGVTLR